MELQNEFGVALIFISHNLAVVRHVSHRILVLYLGRVMEIADHDSQYREPLRPYTKALISAVPLPDPDAEQARERIVLQGDLPSPLTPRSGCVFRTRCPRVEARCAETLPSLESAGADRQVACHFWRESLPWKSQRASNLNTILEISGNESSCPDAALAEWIILMVPVEPCFPSSR